MRRGRAQTYVSKWPNTSYKAPFALQIPKRPLVHILLGSKLDSVVLRGQGRLSCLTRPGDDLLGGPWYLDLGYAASNKYPFHFQGNKLPSLPCTSGIIVKR